MQLTLPLAELKYYIVTNFCGMQTQLYLVIITPCLLAHKFVCSWLYALFSNSIICVNECLHMQC